MEQALRSLLFVPGDDPERIGKAARSAADAVIVDLEDAVAAEAKKEARDALGEAADLLRKNGKYAVVRINADRAVQHWDVLAAVGGNFDAIMVPKVESAAEMTQISCLIAQQKRSNRMPSPKLIALIESARGVISAAKIAEMPRVSALALGTEDFAQSMGVKPDPGVLDLPVRTLALAANACGKAAFALPLSIASFRDSDATRAAALTAASSGCHGALCIHPLQVETVNAAFAPPEDDVAEARAVMTAWMTAQAEGKAVAVAGNRMVDAPVVAWAERILSRAEQVEN